MSRAAAAITGKPVARFEVWKRGSQYTLTINGKRAGSFTDARSLPVRRIGVFLSGRQRVVFHKIIVTGP